MIQSKSSTVCGTSYAHHVNPQWARLLDLLQMNTQYARCSGAELFTSDGRRILDFLSGYCVHNAGHNHPHIIAAIKDELDQYGPTMLQSHVSDLAGELASRLCARAAGRLNKVFFCSSGSEAIEAAIKFSRACTGRHGILFAEGGFHGLTCGALSLMSNPFWRQGFEPLLPGTEGVPFGGLAELEQKVSSKRFAAFIVEPIRGEACANPSTPTTLAGRRRFAVKYETLLVSDEVKQGMPSLEAGFSPRLISGLSPIWSRLPKHSAADSFPAAHS
ncbi:MAG: aminotransferase class III-fold pyridoxal phosphate-dependent enzyme [Terriglobia bacterium]